MLVAVNGRAVQHLPYVQVLEEIRCSGNPVSICFARDHTAAAIAASRAVSQRPRVWQHPE
jgi:hypothetical protein